MNWEKIDRVPLKQPEKYVKAERRSMPLNCQTRVQLKKYRDTQNTSKEYTVGTRRGVNHIINRVTGYINWISTISLLIFFIYFTGKKTNRQLIDLLGHKIN